MAKVEHHGIAIYEILPNGCLNGVWSDTLCKKQVFNEIAKKLSGTNKDDLIGTYDCCYTDVIKGFHNCKLKIKESEDSQYVFEWSETPCDPILGKAWRTKENQITVFFSWFK